jgi:hypothetical protein
MAMERTKSTLKDNLNVLVVGNNPIELSRVFDNLKAIPGKRIITEIAFDLATILDRLILFRPNFILIDDNIGKSELKVAVRALGSGKRTRHVPITILKNSNYEEAISVGVMDYILKENLTGESLYRTLSNSIKFRKTQLYLYKAFKKRKGQLKRIFSNP